MAETDVRQVLKEKLHSRPGRDMITFLIFVVISGILWFVTSLNDTSRREYTVTIAVTDLPAGKYFYIDNGEKIGKNGVIGQYSVSVKEKGILRLNSYRNNTGIIKFNFSDFQESSNGVYYLSSSMMEAALQDFLGDNTVIITWKPLVVMFQSAPVVK